MSTHLVRFRVMAIVTGITLLVLVGVAMPLKYLADSPGTVAAVSPVHGVLYILYVLATVALARTRRWSLGKLLVLLLAGTVPFLSFVAERRITAEVASAETVSRAR